MARRGLGWAGLELTEGSAHLGSLMSHSFLPLTAEMDCVQGRTTLGFLDWDRGQSLLFLRQFLWSKRGMPGLDTGLQPLLTKPAPSRQRFTLDSSVAAPLRSLSGIGERGSQH